MKTAKKLLIKKSWKATIFHSEDEESEDELEAEEKEREVNIGVSKKQAHKDYKDAKKNLAKLAEVGKPDQITLQLPPASTVYFVGDTPESDIRFANSHDISWYSILVKTGVYQEGTEPKYKPKHLCNDVLEAVKFAIEREHEKELAEWNETAGDEDASAAASANNDKGSRLNFADLVMTPTEKKQKEETKKQTESKGLKRPEDAPEAVEVPVGLAEQLEKLKDVGK